MVYHFQYILLNFFLIPSALQDINKRLSLPADIRLPEGYLEKFAMNSPPFDKPMSRRLRRASLVSVCVCVCVHVYKQHWNKFGFIFACWTSNDRPRRIIGRTGQCFFVG